MQSLFERRTKERTSQLLEKNYGQKSIPSMYCIPNKYHHPPLTCRCTQANKQIVSVINGCAAALTWNFQIFFGWTANKDEGSKIQQPWFRWVSCLTTKGTHQMKKKKHLLSGIVQITSLPPIPPFRATWSFFWTSTTTFCARGRKKYQWWQGWLPNAHCKLTFSSSLPI